MKNAIARFLIGLCENPGLRRGYGRDREQAMDDHGLSEGDKRALRDEDLAGIYRAAGADWSYLPPKIIFFPYVLG